MLSGLSTGDRSACLVIEGLEWKLNHDILVPPDFLGTLDLPTATVAGKAVFE